VIFPQSQIAADIGEMTTDTEMYELLAFTGKLASAPWGFDFAASSVLGEARRLLAKSSGRGAVQSPVRR
jgi:hypothetical protein